MQKRFGSVGVSERVCRAKRRQMSTKKQKINNMEETKMKTTKRTFGKLLALVLVCLFALTAVVSVFAEPAPAEGQGALTVTIRNNEGLPKMTEGQFSVYQIFKGTAHQESVITSADSSGATTSGATTSGASEWGATEWNNWTLADITWGESITDREALVNALKALEEEENPWAFEGPAEPKTNVFADVTAENPESLAKVLAAHPENAFLQSFSEYLMANKTTLKIEPLTFEAGNPKLATGKTPAEDSLTFTFKDAGYYLFAENPADHTGTEDAVAEYMLAVVGQQDILLKASVPGVEKDIATTEGDKKGDVAGVGDEVTFKLTGTLPKNFGDFDTYYYLFTDTLSKGLSLKTDSFVVTVEKGGKTYTIDPNEYAVFPYGTLIDPPGTSTLITVAFDDLINGGKGLSYNTSEGVASGETVVLDSTAKIIVTYKATVNTDAVIGGAEGNPNDVDLTYSNDPNSNSRGKTEKKTVYVYAFGLDLTKVGSDDAHDTEGLSGAGFVLKNTVTGKYAQFKEQYVIETTVEGKKTTTFADSMPSPVPEGATVTGPVRRLTGWVEAAIVTAAIEEYDNAADASAKENAKKALAVYLLESGANGKIPNIYGLDAGKYALEEVITPDGYNTMDDFDIEIQAEINENTGKLVEVTYIHGEETIHYTDTTNAAIFQSGLLPDTLTNQKAPFLPFTGGIGTLIFYVLGIALIGGAVTYLVIASKKRKKAEENA